MTVMLAELNTLFLSTERYVPGAFATVGTKGDTITAGTLEIKGRGTSTRSMSS